MRMIMSGRMRWIEHIARMEENNAYKILVLQPEGQKTIGRPRQKWVDEHSNGSSGSINNRDFLVEKNSSAWS
jgi:hypothetical protein